MKETGKFVKLSLHEMAKEIVVEGDLNCMDCKSNVEEGKKAFLLTANGVGVKGGVCKPCLNKRKRESEYIKSAKDYPKAN